MGFSLKAKHYFYEVLKIDNRTIAKRMNNYNEALVSRYLNQDKISPTFILKIKKYFPEADVDSWMDNTEVNEPAENYQTNPVKRINNIIAELELLKQDYKRLSQK